ncbi:MAG TPA: hypothetical protein VLS27_00785 [Gammaproteobacteria bacterium]|nr:hypothetical protein [Gammaproteobacteria bacterium]
MKSRTEPSILDLSLRARYLRSACLASLLARTLHRIRGAAAGTETAARKPELAFERR